jgi:protein-disulfide isomerase
MFSRIAVCLGLAISLYAQDGITRAQADAILQELRQIRALLERQNAQAAPPAPAPPQPQKASLKLDRREYMGSKDAPVTMVEFTDYQCPFCQRFHMNTFPEIKKNFIDTGKVKFYSVDMPLNFHPNAAKAAEAARCAGEQMRFWAMHDLLGANAAKLDLDSMTGFAKQIGLNTDAFRKCVESGKHAAAVQADLQEVSRVGATGTPTFLVGASTAEGVTGELIEGALPYPMFEQKLNSLLNAK